MTVPFLQVCRRAGLRSTPGAVRTPWSAIALSMAIGLGASLPAQAQIAPGGTSGTTVSTTGNAPGATGVANPDGPIPGCREMVASGNPQYPPYLWRDPADDTRLMGAAAELTQWLAREIGVPIQIRHIGPWGRVQAEARAGNVDLVAGAFFTLPRTEYLDYFYPAFRETRSAVWIAKDTKLPYKRWSDLVPKRGVTVINNSFGEEFDRFARERLNIAQVASLEQAIQMVQRGRADYLIYEDSPAAAYMARLGVTNLKPLSPPVAAENLYVALSHRSACNTPELRGRLQRALYKLARERQFEAFVERAMALWKRQGN
jgi:polar amino acid transport system substrate-binding protein